MFIFLARIKPSRRMKLVLAGCALILVAGGTALYRYSRGTLAEFVNQDLRKLDDGPQTAPMKLLARFLPEEMTSPRARLNKLLRRILPDEFKPVGFGAGFQPWYLWELKTEAGSRYILFEGSSAAAIHFLDSSGRYNGGSRFSVGGWGLGFSPGIGIKDAALLHHELVSAPVIEIQTVPSWNSDKITRQLYGIFENRVALLRIEDSNGKAVANSYGDALIGPMPPARTADAWEDLLHSPDRTRVLEALMWIGAWHWTHAEPPSQAVSAEQVAMGRLVVAVRKRPTVQQRMGELTTSANPWIREAAELAQEQIQKQAAR
jgi:hypothetical protein